MVQVFIKHSPATNAGGIVVNACPDPVEAMEMPVVADAAVRVTVNNAGVAPAPKLPPRPVTMEVPLLMTCVWPGSVSA